MSSFYVSAFPKFYSAKDLFELFCGVGKAVEAAIVPRRNNIGQHFGFARFADVEGDGRMLDVHLNNILIGGKKIQVNLPRF